MYIESEKVRAALPYVGQSFIIHLCGVNREKCVCSYVISQGGFNLFYIFNKDYIISYNVLCKDVAVGGEG